MRSKYRHFIFSLELFIYIFEFWIKFNESILNVYSLDDTSIDINAKDDDGKVKYNDEDGTPSYGDATTY